MKKFLKSLLKTILKNILLCLVVLFIGLMFLYGKILSDHGYSLPINVEQKSYVVLALTKIGDGIFPWNMNKEKTSPSYAEAPSHVSISVNNLGISVDGKQINNNVPAATDNGEIVPDNYMIGPVYYDYYDDAVFIGDSRMEGVYFFAGLENATFLTKPAMSIYNLLDFKVSNPDYETVREGLESQKYGKIFIMVGINEIGTGNSEYFVNAYWNVISEIRELQPEAIIVIEAIPHVTTSKSATDKYFNNERINERNDALSQMANNVDIFYLDVNPYYDDEEGNLPDDYSSDGIHILGNKYGQWFKFLLENGIYKQSESEKYKDLIEALEKERKEAEEQKSISDNEAHDTISDNNVEDAESKESTDEANDSLSDEKTDESISENEAE